MKLRRCGSVQIFVGDIKIALTRKLSSSRNACFHSFSKYCALLSDVVKCKNYNVHTYIYILFFYRRETWSVD